MFDLYSVKRKNQMGGATPILQILTPATINPFYTILVEKFNVCGAFIMCYYYRVYKEVLKGLLSKFG